MTTAEYRLKTQYPDFDKVVNEATIAALNEKNPALALAISQSSTDIYVKGSAAYEAIKNAGLYIEDNYSQDRLKAQQNMVRPKAAQSISSSTSKTGSPTSANPYDGKLTDEYKQKMWEEINRYRNT
jgi:hypothetical protein